MSEKLKVSRKERDRIQYTRRGQAKAKANYQIDKMMRSAQAAALQAKRESIHTTVRNIASARERHLQMRGCEMELTESLLISQDLIYDPENHKESSIILESILEETK